MTPHLLIAAAAGLLQTPVAPAPAPRADRAVALFGEFCVKTFVPGFAPATPFDETEWANEALAPEALAALQAGRTGGYGMRFRNGGLEAVLHSDPRGACSIRIARAPAPELLTTTEALAGEIARLGHGAAERQPPRAALPDTPSGPTAHGWTVPTATGRMTITLLSTDPPMGAVQHVLTIGDGR